MMSFCVSSFAVCGKPSPYHRCTLRFLAGIPLVLPVPATVLTGYYIIPVVSPSHGLTCAFCYLYP